MPRNATAQAPNRLTVPALTRALHPFAERAGKVPPKYNSVSGKVRDGLIEAEFDGKQYWIDADQVPAVAALFGLTEPAGAQYRRRRAA